MVPDVVPFSDAALAQALANTCFPAEDVSKHKVARYLGEYLSKLGASTIVVEHDYTDGDYLEDFVAYYSRCHTDYQRRCKRVHFFSIAINADEFESLVRGTVVKERSTEIAESYLGFVVARPLPGPIIGRTALRVYAPDAGRRNYPCVHTYTANLHGIPLQVTSLAFQEQDSVVAACATVALWSAFHQTSALFSTPAPRPALITAAATDSLKTARPIPSRGLIVEQICSAVADVGLEPEVVDVRGRPVVPLASLIYAHVRIGLPVILGVEVEGAGLHAVTATGYSLEKTPTLPRSVASANKWLPMVGQRIGAFYVHDDQIGPFARINVNPPDTYQGDPYPIVFDGSWTDDTTGQSRKMYPVVALIPVYSKIRVTFLDIHSWSARLDALLSTIVSQREDREWDIFLTTTNEFKNSLKSTWTGSGDDLQALMLRQHPRFLWRSSLQIGGRPVLELVADATDIPGRLPFKWILWQDQVIRRSLRSLLALRGLQAILDQMLTRPFKEFLTDQS